jgi:SAM-dependent methyltransferase
MLYHVAEPRVALAELRRVTRPGGPVVILTNGRDHLRVLRDLRDEAIGTDVPLVVPSDRFGLEHAGLVEEVFGAVDLHELRGEITITEPAPLIDYLASSRQFFEAASILPWDALVDRFADVVAGHLADGPVVLHSHSGFFRARA